MIGRLIAPIAALAALGLTASVHAEINFESQILPILKSECIDCHRAPYEENGQKKQPKGGLRLDGRLAIEQGGSSGDVIVPGDPEGSLLYELIALPENHDDIMPPKGGPLTKNQILAIGMWIKEGANFGNWKGNEEGVSLTKREMAPSAADNLAKGATEAGKDVLDTLAKEGATITPVAPGNPLLRVEYLSGEMRPEDAHVSQLASIGSNITELVLSKAAITDQSAKIIGSFSKLTYLDLHNTQITDASIDAIAQLQHLEYLNLYGTSVSDASLPKIAQLRNLKSVYFWQTSVTDGGAEKLRQALPDARVVME